MLFWSVVCSSRSSHQRSATILEKTPTQVFCCESAKFLRTPILQNICEQLLLQFSNKFLYGILLRFFCHKIFEIIHAKNVLLNVIDKKSFSLTKSKKENKLIRREENRILSTKYYYIRAFDLVTINRDTFSFVLEYAVFFLSPEYYGQVVMKSNQTL